MVYGENDNVMNSLSIVFNNVTIECTSFEMHLGNPLSSFDCNVAVKEAVKLLYSRFNWFQYTDIVTNYFLFKSYCMMVYGPSLWNYESKDIEIFYVAWRRCC